MNHEKNRFKKPIIISATIIGVFLLLIVIANSIVLDDCASSPCTTKPGESSLGCIAPTVCVKVTLLDKIINFVF